MSICSSIQAYDREVALIGLSDITTHQQHLVVQENFKAIMTEAVSKSQTIEKANLDRLDKKQLLADLRKEIE